jgi:hypothetical protein
MRSWSTATVVATPMRCVEDCTYLDEGELVVVENGLRVG